MTEVSIITPFKNAEKYIRATAASIFSQDWKKWEWILVNDHSEENELKELASFISDRRITVVNNNGSGIVDALVTAFDLVKGKYVTRMDADDIMPPEKLSLFVEQLESTDARIITGKVRYFLDEGNLSAGYQQYEQWLNERVDNQDFYATIYRECTVASGNWMMRTVDLKKCGGFNALNYPEDYDLLFRWYAHGIKIKGIQQVTHLWRDHDLRTSKNSNHYQQPAFFKLKINHFIAQDWNPDITLLLHGTGQKGRLVAKQLIENAIPFVWISHEPEKFPCGIYQQAVIGLCELQYSKDVQLLQTTLHADREMHKWYSEKADNLQIFRL